MARRVGEWRVVVLELGAGDECSAEGGVKNYNRDSCFKRARTFVNGEGLQHTVVHDHPIVAQLAASAGHAARAALVGGATKPKLGIRTAAAHVAQPLFLLFAIQIGASISHMRDNNKTNHAN